MNSRGFQLIDALLACMVVVLAASLGAAAWDGAAEQHRLHAACQLLVSTCHQARNRALTKNLPTEIRVHLSRRSFGLAAEGKPPHRWLDLPKDVQFVSFPTNAVRFYSRGVAAPGGSFVLGNAAGRIQVIVAPSGRVRWTRLA
jgi:hypothetical protein